MPGDGGNNDNNPVVQYNRNRSKIDFGNRHRQSIVAPEELLQGKKKLKQVSNASIQKRRSIVMPKELIQGKARLTPTKKKQKAIRKKPINIGKTIAHVQSMEDTFEWLEKSGAKVSEEHSK